jgi:hypothetical protein
VVSEDSADLAGAVPTEDIEVAVVVRAVAIGVEVVGVEGLAGAPEVA